MDGNYENDGSWVRGLFGVSPYSQDLRSARSKFFTTADLKFADTTLGGNKAINPLPQFTRFADLKAGGLLATPNPYDSRTSATAFDSEDNRGSFRLGRKYSETIDDYSQYLHLRFGVPKYAGITNYYLNMYNMDAGYLAKTGEYSSFFRTLGKAFGLYGMFAVFGPTVFFPLIIGGKIIDLALGKSPSKYYYLKPTMNIHLQCLQAMLDTQLLHSRLVPMIDFIGKDRYISVDEEANHNHQAMNDIYEAFPAIWKSSGKFDVYRMINRYQILANYQTKVLNGIYEKANSPEDYEARVRAYVKMAKDRNVMQALAMEQKYNLFDLAKSYADNPAYQLSSKDEAERQEAWNKIQSQLDTESGYSSEQVTGEQTGGNPSAVEQQAQDAEKQSTFGEFWNGIVGPAATQMVSELNEGAQWLTLRVNAKGTRSDSISNSTTAPDIAGVINGASAKARSLRISAAGGQTGIELIDGASKAVTDFIGGALSSIDIVGLAKFFGSAKAEFPDVWDDSSISLSNESYTLQLRSPYGNEISIFQNITVPLCAILAGALPMATGKQSYTSPLLCEAYCQGRQISRLAIIDSISITRGAGNMGWRTDGKMLGCDVTINIKDLSKVMTMPIIKDPGILDDDNMFTDYMATIGAASLTDLTYDVSKVIFNANLFVQSWKSRFQVGRMVNDVGAWQISRVISSLAAGTAK